MKRGCTTTRLLRYPDEAVRWPRVQAVHGPGRASPVDQGRANAGSTGVRAPDATTRASAIAFCCAT